MYDVFYAVHVQFSYFEKLKSYLLTQGNILEVYWTKTEVNITNLYDFYKSRKIVQEYDVTVKSIVS